MSHLRTPSQDAKIEFLEFHQPALESGEYKVELEQRLDSGKTGKCTFTKDLTFAVTGERFGPLAPKDIAAVFPPADGVVNQSHLLPHIAFRRSTLPWERFPGEKDENLSWLALLLFRESDFLEEENRADKPKVTILKLRDLLNAPASAPLFPKTLELEVGQQENDEVTVLDVKKKTLAPLLPTHEELALLAHAHQRKAKCGAPEGDPEATVFCKRLPDPNGANTVYLVSLERRYRDGNFDFQGATDDGWIRLVVLTSWSFHCVDQGKGFADLLRKIDHKTGELRAPEGTVPAESAAAPYLEQGYVALPHRMRRGSKSVSFYRGPLVPGENADSLGSLLPAECADQLLRYDPAISMFDVSYAAAWELGRLLTLANTRVALQLANANRQSAQQAAAARQRAARRLPLRRRKAGESPEPDAVTTWLKDLACLRGLPFSYLVPDERLLPIESIRFFQLDPLWVECLRDGARSMGRLTKADHELERARRAQRALGEPAEKVSGFVMRSSVVKGWPKLLVEAYNIRAEGKEPIDAKHVLQQQRVDRLAEDVLLGLFYGDGEIKTLDVFQAPEGLNFGLDDQKDIAGPFTKNLRGPQGVGLDEEIKQIPWSAEGKGVINVKQLATEMDNILKRKYPLSEGEPPRRFTAAQFASQMIEGEPRIRFVAGG